MLHFSSVQLLSCVWLFATHGLQHARLPCPSPTPEVYSNSSPLSRWCHLTNSSSVIPFSSCLQFFLASGSFQMSQFFTSGGQSIGSFSFSISPSNEYSGLISFRIDWFDLFAVQGLSRVFSNTRVQKRQFFGTQWIRDKNPHLGPPFNGHLYRSHLLYFPNEDI